jgi:dTDP-4-dehydrorhamnose reductase
MKVLITGANGFLGYYLAEQLLAKKFTVIATGKGNCRLPFSGNQNFQYAEMDFTDPFSVHDVFEKINPDVVVHNGAMSKPDACEQNQMLAYLVNVEGTVQLLINAVESKSFFVYLSTDFVFDGKKGKYKEDDPLNPVNYYGRTKQESEEAVREYEFDWSIVRMSFVYGKNHSGRKSFPELIREKLEKGEEYNVVADQFRSPTYVEDLARGIVSIIEKRTTGIFHFSGNETLSPYQVAVKTAEYLGLNHTLIKRVTGFTEPARRPTRTDLVNDKAKKELGFNPVSFEEGLKKTLN